MNLSNLFKILNVHYNFYSNEIKKYNNNEIIKTYILSILLFLEKLKLSLNNNVIFSIFNNNNEKIVIPFLLDKPKEYIFNQGFYINLDESVDRKKNIENMDFKIKMDRFQAVKHENGNIGCTMSHIKLLKSLLNDEGSNENTYFLIVEDDIEILNNNKYNNLLININNVLTYHSPDIIVLSGTDKIVDLTSYYGFGFYKLLKSHTTSSYIINYKFIPELIKKFELGLKGLLTINNEDISLVRDTKLNLYCCDQIWNNNIIEENWILYNDMNIIRPNLSFTTTINPETVHNKEETNKLLLESFSSCLCVNKQFYNIRKDLLYHKQYSILKDIIKFIENSNKGNLKCFYNNNI